MTCPDGTQYGTSDRKTLTYCSTGPGAPGIDWNSDNTYVNFGFGEMVGLPPIPGSGWACFKNQI